MRGKHTDGRTVTGTVLRLRGHSCAKRGITGQTPTREGFPVDRATLDSITQRTLGLCAVASITLLAGYLLAGILTTAT